MDTNSADTIYRFGAFELLVRRQLLFCSGSPVRLGSRAVAILCLLVERASELVSKEELTAAAWPNTFVHDSNLKVNVAALRRALTAHDPGQNYIVSVPRRGYRFVGTVHREAAPRLTHTSSAQCTSLPTATPLLGRSQDIAVVCEALEGLGHSLMRGCAGPVP